MTQFQLGVENGDTVHRLTFTWTPSSPSHYCGQSQRLLIVLFVACEDVEPVMVSSPQKEGASAKECASS